MQREIRAVGVGPRLGELADGARLERPLNIRSAERRRYAAELLRDDVTALVLTGMGGIGKTILARQIADRMRAIRPSAPLTILDDFQPTPNDLRPAAGKLLITCREPLEFPHSSVISRNIGPITRSGADELMLALPRLRTLNPVERDTVWRLVAGHPGALVELDRRLDAEGFACITARLRAAVAAVPGGLPDRIGPTELPASLAVSIAGAALAGLRQPANPVPVPAISQPPRRRLRWALTATGAVVILAALALATQSQYPGTSPSPGAGGSHPATPMVLAREWLATELAPGTAVACEPGDCGLPRVAGEASVLVVSGNRAATRAAAKLASFGTGAHRVQILLAAPQAEINADMFVRRMAGRQLAGNPNLRLSRAARGQLTSGGVDARLLITLAALSQTEPANVIAFADSGPGASPAIPFRRVALRLADPAAVRASLLAQRAPFRPARVTITGSGLLIIGFSAPSPLGLLNG